MGSKAKKKPVVKTKKAEIFDYKKNFPSIVPTPKGTKSTFGKDLNEVIKNAGGFASFNAQQPSPKGIRQFKKQDGSYFSEMDKNTDDYIRD